MRRLLTLTWLTGLLAVGLHQAYAQPDATFRVTVSLSSTNPPSGGGPVNLGAAAHFSILAGSAITSTAGGTNYGDVGLSPSTGANITGLTTDRVDGTIYTVDAGGPLGSVVDPDLLTAAKNDLTKAYTNAAGRPVDSTVATELGGSTRTSGVYDSASGTFGITGILTLDAAGDPDAVFIFKMATTLITASYSQVDLTRGAQARNVFWQVGSSATLGTDTQFAGSILADQSVTLTTGADLAGRVVALNAAVTLDDNTITVPESANTFVLFAGVVGLVLGVRKFQQRS